MKLSELMKSERVLPIVHYKKRPSFSWKKMRTWEESPENHKNQATGKCFLAGHSESGPSIVVIDLDIPKGDNEGLQSGYDNLLAWIKENDSESLPTYRNTTRVESASGGIHLYFTYPQDKKIRNNASAVVPFMDVRAHGGIIMLPGSKVKNSEGEIQEYKLAKDSEILPIPESLLEKLEEKPYKKPVVSYEYNYEKLEDSRLDAYLSKCVSNAAERMASTMTGRNNVLNDEAYNLGQLGIDFFEVEHALGGAALSVGMPQREVNYTLKRSYREGLNNPKEINVVKNKTEDYQEVKSMNNNTVKFEDIVDFDDNDDILTADIFDDVDNNNTVNNDNDKEVKDKEKKQELKDKEAKKKAQEKKKSEEEKLKSVGLDDLSMSRFWKNKVREAGIVQIAETGDYLKYNEETKCFHPFVTTKSWLEETKDEAVNKWEQWSNNENINIDKTLVRMEKRVFFNEGEAQLSKKQYKSVEMNSNPYEVLDASGKALNPTTGKTREVGPEDKFSFRLPVSYFPWESLKDDKDYEKEKEELFELLSALDSGTLEYLKRIWGSALLGIQSKHSLIFWNVAKGGSGKTAVMSIVKAAFGDYGGGTDSEVLAKDKGHTEFLNALEGKRAVFVEEAPSGHLNADAMKKVTGNPSVWMRSLYGSLREVPITWHMFINTNHKPRVRKVDAENGTFRRIVIIPWLNQFSNTEKDKTHFMDLHKNEKVLTLFLSWIVEGCKEWYQDTSLEKAFSYEMIKAKEEWLDYVTQDTDPVSLFLTDNIEKDNNSYVFSDELFKVFIEWCEAENITYKESRVKFLKQVEEKLEGGKSEKCRPAGRKPSLYFSSHLKSIDPQNRKNKIIGLKFA